MSTMKAIPITGLGGLDVLSSSDVPLPTAGPDDVLIKVHAVSINPVETKIRAGKWAGGNLPVGLLKLLWRSVINYFQRPVPSLVSTHPEQSTR